MAFSHCRQNSLNSGSPLQSPQRCHPLPRAATSNMAAPPHIPSCSLLVFLPFLTSATAPQPPLIGHSTEMPFSNWLKCHRLAGTGCDRFEAEPICLPHNSRWLWSLSVYAQHRMRFISNTLFPLQFPSAGTLLLCRSRLWKWGSACGPGLSGTAKSSSCALLLLSYLRLEGGFVFIMWILAYGKSISSSRMMFLIRSVLH